MIRMIEMLMREEDADDEGVMMMSRNRAKEAEDTGDDK